MLHKDSRSFSEISSGVRTATGLLALALVVLGMTPCRAGTLDIVVMSTVTPPGTAGQFDIDLVNNSASAVTIGSFSVDVLLSDSTFVTFTAIDNATTAPYIFSVTGSLPPGFGSNLLPMEVAGFDTAASGGQVVNPGDTWGLAHVRYLTDDAPPGTVVDVTLQPTPVFLPPPGGTSLTDNLGNPVGFTPVNGTITIQSPAVPEPSAVSMLAIAAGVLLAARRLRNVTRA